VYGQQLQQPNEELRAALIGQRSTRTNSRQLTAGWRSLEVVLRAATLFKKALFKKCSALPRSDSVRGLLLQGWELAGGTRRRGAAHFKLCPGARVLARV
jgi:hypothetical protein